MRRSIYIIRNILLCISMSESNLVLIVQPILVIRPETNIQYPLLEPFFYQNFIFFVRPSVGSGKIVAKMRRSSNDRTPGTNDRFCLTFQGKTSKMQIVYIFLR